MAMGVALTFFVRRSAGALGVTWPLGAVPPSDLFWIQRLSSLGVMWGYQLTLATFILTFFLGQAYSFWRSQFSLAFVLAAAHTPDTVSLSSKPQPTVHTGHCPQAW
jgi:hypothetical protein